METKIDYLSKEDQQGIVYGCLLAIIVICVATPMLAVLLIAPDNDSVAYAIWIAVLEMTLLILTVHVVAEDEPPERRRTK